MGDSQLEVILPEGTFGNVQGHFWLLQLVAELLLASNIENEDAARHPIMHRWSSTATRVQNVIRAEIKKA
jgi:hypothetical protein